VHGHRWEKFTERKHFRRCITLRSDLRGGGEIIFPLCDNVIHILSIDSLQPDGLLVDFVGY